MRFRHPQIWILIACLLLPAGTLLAKKKPEPQVVGVQHILIAFKGSGSGKKIDRTKKQAQALAEELFRRAEDGEDFDALVKEYTNDSYPGKYRMSNRGAPHMSNVVPRNGMVMFFGDVAFGLEVGEVGLARHHPAHSPYGWHIIKRLE